MSDVPFTIEGLGPPRTRGRPAKPVSAEFSRELTPGDMAALAETRESAAPSIKKLRDRHHAIARLLAAGHRPAEVAIITGYSTSRISILQADPQFADLLDFYRTNEDVALVDLQKRMATLSAEAWAEIADRLEDDPESFSERMLLEIATATADRTGHSPKGSSGGDAGPINLTINIAERMQRAAERVSSFRSNGNGAVQVIEGKALPRASE